MAKSPAFYEHIDPALVGNARDVLVSDQAGRANLMFRFAEMGLDVDPDPEQTAALLALIKEREAEGWVYDGAAASFEVLVRRALGQVPDYFELLSFRVIDERRFNAMGELVTTSEATIKVSVGGQELLHRRRRQRAGERARPCAARRRWPRPTRASSGCS